MKTKYKVKFKEWDCILEFGLYHNGELAMWLTGAPETENEGENIATCTVNIPEQSIKDNHVFIKEWSENDGMTEALIKAEIVKPNFTLIPVGPHGSFASVCELNIVPFF